MLVPCAFQLAAMAGRMLLLSPILSVATILVLPFMSFTIAILGEKLRRLSRKGQDSVANLSAYLNEVLLSIFVVKAYVAEGYEQMRFKKLAFVDYRAHLLKKKMKAFIPEVITAVYAATAVVLFGVGTWVISKGGFNASGMISFVTSLVFLIEPIQAIGKAYNDLKQGEPAIERLFELTANYSKIVEKAGAITLAKVSGDVKFSNVFFAYGDCPPWVLSNLHLDVRAGETVALVGPSGGGKTTLAKLLLRLYDPVHGQIYIDGHDIREIGLKSLRREVGIVPQDIVLFTGTVLENIAYGVLPDQMDFKAVEQAAGLANADEFIRKLPSGYHSNLGGRGSNLSGGQRQRLAIARAIYQNPSILILDEATSALDNNSEKLVREALDQLMRNRTVFVIAHRLETVQRADRIFVINGGRLVEEGTHSSLLAEGGLYSSLYTYKAEIGGLSSHPFI
ncbi:hypothetical protein O6H91_09G093300 [Diphasiastrum complanatum]|nr:hypothetical protein O6H91_09G093300 [Diphasiastrum complanatum]